MLFHSDHTPQLSRERATANFNQNNELSRYQKTLELLVCEGFEENLNSFPPTLQLFFNLFPMPILDYVAY